MWWTAMNEPEKVRNVAAWLTSQVRQPTCRVCGKPATVKTIGNCLREYRCVDGHVE